MALPYNAVDDKRLFIIRRNLSGGINNRQAGNQIPEVQATNLLNADIGVAGEVRKRPGLTLIEDLGSDTGTCAFGFMPDGGTHELLVTHGTKLEGYVGTGTFTEHDTGFTSGLRTQMIKVWKSGGSGSVAMIQNGTDNPHEMSQAHVVTDLGSGTGATADPPKSLANLFYRGRWWILKDNNLYFSSAYPSDYANSFDTSTGYFKINCGAERFLLGIRDMGIIVTGKDSIWGINPSVTPAATDKPEKIIDIGCVANNTGCMVGDDIWFMAPDGVRGLFRTQQDKIQLGQSFPLSYLLKDEFESISWSHIHKATGVYFDNKYFLSLPVDASTYNNEVWVFYPSIQIPIPTGGSVPAAVVIKGWEVADWGKVKLSGQERLYAIESNDGKVHRAWYGYSDNGTAIDYTEEGRKEDLGQPMVKKVGGEVKIKALASGDYDLSVYAEADDGGYTSLGIMNLEGEAPTLPVALPFTLAPPNIIEEQFHLDSFGEWNTLRLKLRHNALNGSDQIKIYERQIISFSTEYQSE